MKVLALECPKRGQGHEHFLQAIKFGQELGFEAFSLRLRAGNTELDTLFQLARTQAAKIVQLCFLAPEAQSENEEHFDYSKLSSPDQTLREASLAHIKNTLSKLSVSRVQSLVFDGGEVDLPEKKIYQDSLQKGKIPQQQEIRAWSEQRAACLDVYLDALCRSCYQLSKQYQNVKILLRTPNSPFGVCFPEALEQVLNDSYQAYRGYWHDSAAALWLEKLGLLEHAEWFNRFGSSMAGLSLNDLIIHEKGHPPGMGEVDFKGMSSALGSSTLRTLDCYRNLSEQTLRLSYDYLEAAKVF